MGEPIATASAIINLVEKFEDKAADFYLKLAQKYPKNKETFLSFSEESKKNKILVVRTYRETITDALEACFSFEGLSTKDYETKTSLGEKTSFPEALRMAIELEDESAEFYRRLGERYAQGRDVFLSLAKECARDRVLVTRTYQETITDALETGFSFKRLDLSRYVADTGLRVETSYADALGIAVQLEEKASAFYEEAADMSESLLATIPKAFRRIADERNRRKVKLGSMIKSCGSSKPCSRRIVTVTKRPER